MTAPHSDWDDFVLSRDDSSFFHRSAWRTVAQEAFGHTPHFLEVRRGGALAAVLPLVEVKSKVFGHSLISNAFCVGGGPLAVDDDALAEILVQATDLGRKLAVDYVELRDTPRADGWIARGDLYAGFSRAIPADEEANMLWIPKKQRAVVRKARTMDLSVTIDADMNDFFAVYATTMRDHGTPALPKRFFETLAKTFGTDCEVLTVRKDGRPISSVLSYYFKDAVLPYYTGSRNEARGLGSNDLMYWAVMRRAVERGYGVFDFGRSKVGTGPFNFKKNWGFEPRPITHQFLTVKASEPPNLNPTNPKYALMIAAWRKLPVPVATAISPFISRSLA
jgi:FemAB-related protein (PEP-CTERM system-associated)